MRYLLIFFLLINLISYSQDTTNYYIPNSFTPNDDGLNDIFLVQLKEDFKPYYFRLRIYDRCGKVISDLQHPLIGWTGFYGGVTSGVYNWTLEINDECIKTGKITLIK